MNDRIGSPLISVVLPVRDGERHLRDAIDSVRSQTLHDWEMIVVDDASSDRSGEIAREVAATDARIRIVRSDTNLRLPGALNRGFSEARGRYLTWTSHDNEYLPNALERLLEAIGTGAGLAYADFAGVDAEGADVGIVRLAEPADLVYGNCVGACFLYSSEAAHRAGEYRRDLELVEDYEYWLRLSRVTRFVHVPVVLYRYRVHDASLSRRREAEVALLDVSMRQRTVRRSDVADRARYYDSLYDRLYMYRGRALRIPGLWWRSPATFIRLVLRENAETKPARREARRQRFWASRTAAILSRIKRGLYRVVGRKAEG